MATHSSILVWEIPWTEESRGATVHGVTRVGHDLATKPSPPSYLVVENAEVQKGKVICPKSHS